MQENTLGRGILLFGPAIMMTVAAQVAALALASWGSTPPLTRATYFVACLAVLGAITSFVSTRAPFSKWETVPAALTTFVVWVVGLGIGCHILCELLGLGHVVENASTAALIEISPAIAGGLLAARAVVRAKETARPYSGRDGDFLDDLLDGLEYRFRVVAASVSRRGVSGTAFVLARRILHNALAYKATKGSDHESLERLDRKLGIRTADVTHLSALEIASPNVALGVDYQASPPEEVDRALHDLPIRCEDFVFVDVGCGRGLVLLLAARFPFRQIVGVDFSPDLCDDARENIARCQDPEQQCRDMAVVCDDATRFELPDAPTVLYLFNPFRRPVLEAFLEHIATAQEDALRPLYLIYYGGFNHRTIRKTGRFTAVRRTFAYTIYEYREAQSK